MVLLPASIIGLSFLIIFLAHHLIQRLKYNLPPGPTPWPIVGNIYSLKPVHFRCFNEWAQSYGPVISVWFGSTLNIVVLSSELAKEVLKDHDHELANRQRIRSQANFTKNGMDLTWANYGPHYVKLRKLCNLELFSNKKVEALKLIREDEITTMIQSIYEDCTENSKKGTITLRKYLGQVAVNHITRITFGKRFINSEGEIDMQGQQLMDIILDVRKIKGPNMVVEHVPWLQWISCFYDPALNNHRDRMDRFAKEIMKEDNKRHFISALVSYKDQYDLSEDTIIGLLWDMIMAGMDTIAITVEWAMAELVKHPRVIQKAQYELDGIIGQDKIMTEEDLVHLPYLQAIIKESLRMHPPTPLMLPHRANSNVKIGGYDVPKEAIVLVNVWAVGRDPAIWHNPNEFRPERFLKEDIDMKGHDFRLLPFGAGRRICLGTQLATNLVTLMVGRLLHHFDWSPPDGVKAEEISMSEIPGLVSYMATPLHIVALPRLPAHLHKRVLVDT